MLPRVIDRQMPLIPLAALAILGSVVPVVRAALPPAPWCPTILTTEHTDVFALDYAGGLALSVDERDNDINYQTDDVLLYVDRTAKGTQPAGSQWSFLGAGAGNDVWILPQTQATTLLYAGANASGVNATLFPPYFESDPRVNSTGRWLKLTLTDVRGPGHFSLYQGSTFGTPTVWMSSFSGGITSTDAFFVVPGSHSHMNWAFSQRGIYEVDVQASGYLGAGQTNPTASAVTTYYFGVETQLSCPVSVASLNTASVLNFDVAARPTLLADAGDGLLAPLANRYDANGNLLVADVLRSRVTKITPSGTASTFADAADGVITPSGMTFDTAGNLFVSNYLTNTVAKVNSAGVGSVFVAGTAGLNSPFGMAANSSDQLFVADLANRRLAKIDSLGNVTTFADSGDGLLAPFGVAVDESNNVYVSDVLTSKIYKFTPAGVGSVFADALDGIATPTGLAFDSNGDLYAADYLTNRVMRIAPDGQTFLYADASDGISSPFDVAALPHVPSGSFATGMGQVNFAAVTRLQNVPEPSGLALAIVGALGCLITSFLRTRRCSARGVFVRG